MNHDGRTREQLHSAEPNKSNLKLYGPFKKAFWAREEFSGMQVDSDADIRTIHFRFPVCDSQHRKLDLKLSVEATVKGGTFREQFRIWIIYNKEVVAALLQDNVWS